MFEIALWSLGFLLLIGVALYAVSVPRKNQNAADRILAKRHIKTIDSVDDLDFDGENTVEIR